MNSNKEISPPLNSNSIEEINENVKHNNKIDINVLKNLREKEGQDLQNNQKLLREDKKIHW